jgi:hypothetical protein
VVDASPPDSAMVAPVSHEEPLNAKRIESKLTAMRACLKGRVIEEKNCPEASSLETEDRAGGADDGPAR